MSTKQVKSATQYLAKINPNLLLGTGLVALLIGAGYLAYSAIRKIQFPSPTQIPGQIFNFGWSMAGEGAGIVKTVKDKVDDKVVDTVTQTTSKLDDTIFVKTDPTTGEKSTDWTNTLLYHLNPIAGLAVGAGKRKVEELKRKEYLQKEREAYYEAGKKTGLYFDPTRGVFV